VVITSEMNDMGKGMKLVWDYLIPAFEEKALPKSKKVQELNKYLNSLSIKPIFVNKNSVTYTGKKLRNFQLEEGKVMPFNAISISDDTKMCSVLLEQKSKSYSFELGKNKWFKNSTDRKGPNLAAQAKNSQEGLAPFSTYGSCTWLSDNELQLYIKYIEGPHTEKILCTFNDDKVSVKYETIMTDKRNPLVFVGTLVK
jgi:hypothetical protein